MLIIFRSIHRRCFVKKCVRKKFANFIGKHLCWSLFWSSSTGVFVWNLQNFQEHLFWRICEWLLLYFRYNFHHHYHYHHLHCHCKMHLYRLRILLTREVLYLTIPLDCNMIPCLFQLNLVRFLRPVKKDSQFVYDHQTNFTCFLYTCIYIYSFLYYSYIHLLIISLYYYMNLIKLLKYGEYRKTK